MSIRIRYLDGLRGIAILLVMLYHAYSRWSDFTPYGYKYSNMIIFKEGRLGVYLFFLISGFVIFMTLEKCTNFKRFLFKRWIRLFPAMLVVTLLIYITSGYFIERPHAITSIRDIVPGLTFLDPHIWEKLLGGTQGYLEGSFWSLYIEFCFYIIFGLMYYLLGSKKAINGLTIIFLCGCFIFVLDMLLGRHWTNNSDLLINEVIGAKYYGWFAAGALFYKHSKKKANLSFICGIILCLLSAIGISRLHLDDFIFCLVITLSFILPLWFERVRSIIESPILIFIGSISYPLYLIHENTLIALIIKLNKAIPGIPDLLLPILPMCLLIFISFLIAKFIEPYIQKVIKSSTNHLAAKKQTIIVDE